MCAFFFIFTITNITSFIEHVSTPVETTVDNRHIQIYMYRLCIHDNYAKRYRDIDSHTDRELDKSLHRKEILSEVFTKETAVLCPNK